MARLQGRIQDFKLGGVGALKKIAPSEFFWGNKKYDI
jgi:hypothetical protein